MTFVTRFAPSPTGFLHLGHAFSALSAFDARCAAEGRFLLRIEDIDQGRCRPEYEAAIFEDLAWLGLAWEAPVRRQSEHLDEYCCALDGLVARGLVYRCFRTRKEVLAALAGAPHGPEPIFFGAQLAQAEEAERLAGGEAFAWRLSISAARKALGPALDHLFVDSDAGAERLDPARLGDVVLARKDFPASYHLACVCDDALQGVTHVIRGEDLRDCAHVHVLLQALLGLPHPLYRHHRLITDSAGVRLAKRDQAASLRALRQSGATPQDVRAMLGLPEFVGN